MNKLVSKQLVDQVKEFEGFSAIPYTDCVGVLTLGYGMTGSLIKGLKSVTKEQASDMLEDILNQWAQPIKADLDSKGVRLTQNQFDALVSISYNIGTAGLLGSTLYRNIVIGIRDTKIITDNFKAWSHDAAGNVIPGLLTRRLVEAKMFLQNTNNTNIEEDDDMRDFTPEQKARQKLFKVPDNNNVVPIGPNITPLNGGKGWIESTDDGRIITHISRVTYEALHSDGSKTVTHLGETRNI